MSDDRKPAAAETPPLFVAVRERSVLVYGLADTPLALSTAAARVSVQRLLDAITVAEGRVPASGP